MSALISLLGVAAVAAAVGFLLFRQQRSTRQVALEMQGDPLLKHFYDLPFIGMAITSPETKRWLKFNDRLCAMFGYTREEMAAANWVDMTHPEDRERDLAECDRVIRGQSEGYAMDKRYIRKDGSILFASINVKCVRQSRGAVDYFVATIEDITERKQVEAALRESEGRFRSLLQGVPTVAVQSYSLDGTTRYWNRASEHFYGYTAEEAIGRNLLDLIIPPEMREGVKQAIQQMAQTGQPIPSAELTLMRKNGSRVTVFSSHASGRVPGREPELFCIDIDLTERKQAEEALRTSEAEFRTLAETMPQIVWVTRPDGWHVHFNQHWMDYTGLTLEESLGHGWNSSFHPEDRPRAAERWQQATESGEPYEIEYRLRRADGVYHWMLARALPLRDGAGNIVKWFGTSTDIDDLKRTLQRLNEAQRIGQIGDWEYDIATHAITWSPQVFEIFGRDPRLGPPRDFEEHAEMYDAASGALMGDKIKRAIASGESQEYELLTRRPDGEEVYVKALAVPRKDERGEVLGLYGTVQDVSARKRAEHALRSRAHQQVLVATLGRFALADAELDHVFAEAASAVAKGLGMEYSNVVQLDADDGSFSLKAGVGWKPEWYGRRISGIDADTRLAGVISSHKPVIIEDFAAEPRASTSEILGAHNIVSGVDVAIHGGEGTCGVLGAYSRAARKFDSDSLEFLQGIANILATAIDRKRGEAKLMHLAQFDALTDLPNRVLLKDRLSVAITQAQRSGKRVAVMFVDLDRFKNVNDSLGHELGDQLLQDVARRLSISVRTADTVSRQGGDEFLVVLPEVESEKDAARVAEKLLGALAAPVSMGGVELIISGSIGIACFPDNGNDADTLLRNADAAMYVAKDMGRNRYQFYSEEMNARAHERLILEADLRRAVERNELFLQFQPQVALSSGAVIGVEALVRWWHPTRGVVLPVQFIAFAEETGLIVSIGDWVLESACRQQAQWVREGIARGPMAVNVSAPQFRQPGFVPSVVQALERTGLAPHQLELELTESVVMHGIDAPRGKLMSLDKLGVKLTIDDFGTGYSSLSYLKQFPIHRLKIDRSFVSGLPEDKESGAIAQAIISMGHSLGLKVVAEGIETEAQAEYLKSLWCDSAQGFLYSRPLMPDDCAAFLRRQLQHLPMPEAE